MNLPDNPWLVVWDRFGSYPVPKPGDPALETHVRNCIAETGRGPWLILDSWASLLKPGEGGEFTGQIAPIYSRLRKLADLGATVSVLDHSRKYDKKTIYGGLDKEAKVDSIHSLSIFPNKIRPNNPIIRVDSYLKRYAPEGTCSFAFEVQSTQDQHGNWHIVDLVAVQDPAEKEKLEHVKLLSNLIKQNPHSGQDALSRLAAGRELPREKAITLLREGVGKYWRTHRASHNKCSYSLIQNQKRKSGAFIAPLFGRSPLATSKLILSLVNQYPAL